MTAVKSLDGFEIIRRLPDGRWEVKNPRGAVLRILILNCRSCRKTNIPPSLFHQPTGECIKCIADRASDLDARKLRQNRMEGLAAANNAEKRRRRMVALAKPVWRDQAAIRKIYKEARAKTEATGIPHHVDHYYPIQGDWCCGLHVHQNLRVLPMMENCTKSAGHPMEDSPALQAALDELGESGLTKAKFEMLRDARLVRC